MDEISQVRSNNWIQMIHARKESGLTVKDWCSQNNVSPFCKNPRSRKPTVRKSPDVLVLCKTEKFPACIPFRIEAHCAVEMSSQPTLCPYSPSRFFSRWDTETVYRPGA